MSRKTDPKYILEGAILNSNIELFLEYFTVDNITEHILAQIVPKPELYLPFELSMENNPALCEKISDHSWCMIYHTMNENNMKLFNIILKYISITKIISYILHAGLTLNNLDIIDSVVTHGYDITSVFKDALPTYHDIIDDANYDSNIAVKLDTILHLAQYGIYISDYTNDVALIFLYYDDLFALKYCLENGANVNYILSEVLYIDINVMQLLLNYGANLNKLNLDQIQSIIHNKDNLNVITYLIENGLDIMHCINDVILYSVIYKDLNMIKFFINLGADIHFDNDILLYCACKMGEIEIITLLLELGAYDDNILLFIEKDYSKYKYWQLDTESPPKKLCEIVKLLLTYNSTIINPSYVFCVYANYNKHSKYIEEELFRIFLDYRIDFNFKYKSLYILEFLSQRGLYQLIKICLEYGADLYINNCSALKEALLANNIKTTRTLLKEGSYVDSNWCFGVEEKMIKLLDKYHIEHNLKKIDNKS